MGKGLSEPDANIVDEEFGREIVRCLNYEIVGGNDLLGIGFGNPTGIGNQVKIRPEPGDTPSGGDRFFSAHILAPMEDLALQVGQLHPVFVYDPNLPDAAGGKIIEGGTPQSAQSDDQDTAVEQFELSFYTHFRNTDNGVSP